MAGTVAYCPEFLNAVAVGLGVNGLQRIANVTSRNSSRGIVRQQGHNFGFLADRSRYRSGNGIGVRVGIRFRIRASGWLYLNDQKTIGKAKTIAGSGGAKSRGRFAADRRSIGPDGFF